MEPDQLLQMLTESLLRPEMEVMYDLSLDMGLAQGPTSDPKVEMCRVIAAQPTAGKTTMAKYIRAHGLDVLDTDEPIGYAEPSIFKAKKVNKTAQITFDRWEAALQDLAHRWDIPVLCNHIPQETLNTLGPAEIYFMRVDPGTIYRNELNRHGNPRFSEVEIIRWIANSLQHMSWGRYTVVLPEGTVIHDYIQLHNPRQNKDNRCGLRFAYRYVQQGDMRWILPVTDNKYAYPRLMWKGRTEGLRSSLILGKREAIESIRKRWRDAGVEW